MSFHHIPVLLAECIDGLAIRPDGVYLDGTAGGGRAFIRDRRAPHDRPPHRAGPGPRRRRAAASQRLEGLPATVVQSNFRHADRALAQLGVDGLDGVLLDLGVSSHQLDEVATRLFLPGRRAAGHAHEPERPHGRRPCEHRLPRGELCRHPFKEYGEEPYAWQIAREDR